MSVIEPVKEYRRYQLRPQTMLSPLTGLIDAARPDAKGARDFNNAVEALIRGAKAAENLARLRAMVAGWRAAETELKALIESSPGLTEARPLADDFRSLNQIISEALDALEKKSMMGPEWRDSKMKALDEIAKPKAAVEIITVTGARNLVDAAAGTKKAE